MNDHIVRYKRTHTDEWYYMPLITSKAEAVGTAKTVGKPELGQPAYSEVQVVHLDNPPIVWSSNESTISSTDMEQPLPSNG